MSHLSESLGRLRAAVDILPRRAALPERPESRRVLETMEATGAVPRAPERAAMDALRERLHAAFANRPARLSGRDLRDAPWVMWSGEAPAARIPGLTDAVVRAALPSRRVARALIEAWLHDFVAGNPEIARGGQAITAVLARAEDAALDSWRSAQAGYALFDAASGPGRVAAELLHGPLAVAAVLAATGLDQPPRATGGYARAVAARLLALLPAALRGREAETALDRALAFLAPEGRLRFGREMRGDIAQGLLAAWLDGGREPAPPLREPVRDLLVRDLGDPRLRAPEWTPVGEEGTALVRRWLARASLRAFFDLIAEYALDHQWRYREAFWSAVLDRGAIEDAWLALGAQVHASARTMRDFQGGYGRLRGNVSGDQSVLLLRVGPLILCEWSHSGALRAWPREWANAPRLYQTEYSRDDLTGKGLPFPPNPRFSSRGSADGRGLRHDNPERSRWQGSAAELLARRANVHLSEADWRPR
ncbi:EH signature domain-containing protein [Muricoccus radiodurans]|uniref:EH signature domain-containing protein n=1 Tax=Muricoccus radiodurans TaxID=2231721 RepID=UPI003CF0003D